MGFPPSKSGITGDLVPVVFDFFIAGGAFGRHVGLSLLEAEADWQDFVSEFHDKPMVRDREELCGGVASFPGDRVEGLGGPSVAF